MFMRTSSVYSLDNPISAAFQSPPTETKKLRALRLKAEAKAKRLSDQIDEDLKQERERLKRNNGIKLLLLGQAESVMKQFQLMYKPHSFEQEHISLKAVIYLNIVRSLKHILVTLEAWDDTAEDEADYSQEPHSRRPGDRLSPSTSLRDSGASQIADLRRRLELLVSADGLLADCLHEVKKGRYSQDRVRDNIVQDVARMLWTLEKDIKELWDHTTVKALIEKRRLKLDEGSEFFLKHISRIAELNYFPTTDDILHARVQTTSVQEHVFDMDIGDGKTIPWHLYNVSCAHGKRHSWVPYFDDINAIIFVVPISEFDQILKEDPRINRLEYSVQLFTQICSNRLLKGADLMLILSETDLLRTKLSRGWEVRNYIISFGERTNDYVTVIQYFHQCFLDIYRRHNTRVLYTHVTDVIDFKTTRDIIAFARESVIRRNLESVRIIRT